VHGLQIFINLSGANKPQPPKVFHRADGDLPRASLASGATVKVVVGTFADMVSSLVPAEPLDFLDIDLSGPVTIPLAGDRHGMIYVAGGSARVEADGHKVDLKEQQALAMRGGGDLSLTPTGHDTTIILISAFALREPVFKHGPFVMNDREALHDAVVRYQQGRMGNLAPLGSERR
jgi:redox-sensitive bicupin YhaK (pirin superfamily)